MTQMNVAEIIEQIRKIVSNHHLFGGVVPSTRAHHVDVVSSPKGILIIDCQFFYQSTVPMGQMTPNTCKSNRVVLGATLIAKTKHQNETSN